MTPPPRPPDRPTPVRLLGSFFDIGFNRLIAPRLIKILYLVMLLLVSGQCAFFLLVGLWIAGWRNGWAWGAIMVAACPMVWVAEVLTVRVLLEIAVIRFQDNEYLRALRERAA